MHSEIFLFLEKLSYLGLLSRQNVLTG